LQTLLRRYCADNYVFKIQVMFKTIFFIYKT
jgi:hypothetical protein